MLLQQGDVDGGFSAVLIVVSLVIAVVYIAGVWGVFRKAGQPGWAAIVPFYNWWVLVKVSGKEQWWFVMFLIPIGNIIALFVVSIAVAERFGKSTGFGVGLALLPFVFYPILAWGDATYRGSAGAPASSALPPPMAPPMTPISSPPPPAPPPASPPPPAPPATGP